MANLFKEEQPDQILLPFLENDNCIGNGGLVHINWTDRNAEISFIVNTSLEIKNFEVYWTNFLVLLEEVAWTELNLHKIYTYAFDIRPQLYLALEKNDFFKDATLKDHCCFNGEFIDVIIHSKLYTE